MENTFSNYMIMLIIFLLANFIIIYFKEKGKNLATKNDIEDITKLVEEVKSVFIRNTERLKADLNLLTNIHYSLINEERNAIIDFNEKYFKWLNKINSPMPELYHINSSAKTEVFRTEVLNTFNDVLNSHTKFRLFVEDKDLFRYANNLINETFGINSKMLSYIEETNEINLRLEKYLKFEEDLKLEKHLKLAKHSKLKKRLKLEAKWNRKELARRNKLHKKYKKLIEERSLMHSRFIESIETEDNLVLEMTVTFHFMCRKYLYSLINQNGKD